MKYLLFFLLTLPMQTFAARTWTLTVQVINDSTELPVNGAQVILEDKNGTIGITDSKGIAMFERIKTESMHFTVKMEGFYQQEAFEFSAKRKHDRKITIRFIQTTGPNVTMKLRKRMEESRAKYEVIREKEMEQLQLKLAKIDTNNIAPCIVTDPDFDTSIVSDYNATFPGGIEEMQKFIVHNLKYPERAIEYNEQGTVYVSFIIDLDGSITQVKVIRGVSILLDAEAKRVITGMPDWIPSYCNGRPVKSLLRLPISFTLN